MQSPITISVRNRATGKTFEAKVEHAGKNWIRCSLPGQLIVRVHRTSQNVTSNAWYIDPSSVEKAKAIPVDEENSFAKKVAVGRSKELAEVSFCSLEARHPFSNGKYVGSNPTRSTV